jgi:hypothetical protein
VSSRSVDLLLLEMFSRNFLPPKKMISVSLICRVENPEAKLKGLDRKFEITMSYHLLVAMLYFSMFIFLF